MLENTIMNIKNYEKTMQGKNNQNLSEKNYKLFRSMESFTSKTTLLKKKKDELIFLKNLRTSKILLKERPITWSRN